MQILALEPYYGGSHQTFLDEWSARSRHEWTKLTLPAYKWKWRMRHSAITFAEDVQKQTVEGKMWDLIFCSDMLNLAELLGLLRPDVSKLPAIVYFHENQLTYPVRFESERDYQFAMTNMTTGLAAKSVWFNSTFHKDSFLDALQAFILRMPDFHPIDAVERIREKAVVYSPGVRQITKRKSRKAGPVRILWAARWEHDKNPEDFFKALEILKKRGIGFRLNVVGEQFREVPQIFEGAREDFSEEIERWGYQDNRQEYEKALAEADLVVSTARHEFFGISIVEAILAGAYPVLPARLSYPEILGLGKNDGAEQFFYDGSVGELADKLVELAKKAVEGSVWTKAASEVVQSVERFRWDNVAEVLDKAAEKALTASAEKDLQ